MKVTQSEFIISAVKPEQYPEDALPEIALAGRSNVGKSTLINTLIQRKNLARKSSKPGKTQTINFYLINESFYFADVPGYGFAKVPKSVRHAWGKMMERYLSNREQIKVVIQIVDIRHQPTQDDIQMYDFLQHFNIPVIVAVTKADKISKNKWPKHVKVIKQTMQITKETPVQLFSAETKIGKEELWALLEPYLVVSKTQ